MGGGRLEACRRQRQGDGPHGRGSSHNLGLQPSAGGDHHNSEPTASRLLERPGRVCTTAFVCQPGASIFTDAKERQGERNCDMV